MATLITMAGSGEYTPPTAPTSRVAYTTYLCYAYHNHSIASRARLGINGVMTWRNKEMSITAWHGASPYRKAASWYGGE